jgi:protein-S-isoprenylcysteine O-methyltransferase Ste14
MTEPHVSSQSSRELHPLISGLWLTLNLALGMIPSVGFYAWIERNCTLPIVPLQLGWPWVDGAMWPIPLKLFWNTALFGGFGFLHSALAQNPLQQKLLSAVQARRSVYLVATGLSLVGVAGFWQHSGLLLWALPLPFEAVTLLSFVLFWGLIFLGMSSLVGKDPLGFFGFRQLFETDEQVLRPSGAARLVTSGLYSFVRHPLYTFTLAAFLLTPVLSLDRFWVFAVSCAYLAVGIPVEERKLVALFGQNYRVYQKRVPAVFPRIWSPWSKTS